MFISVGRGRVFRTDNLGSHKSKTVRHAVSAAGARLFLLPKYSPDLNPIERAFAKIKHRTRQAQMRSRKDIGRRLAYPIATINAGECANDFENAGYASVET